MLTLLALLAMMLVFLHRVFSHTSEDGTTNGSQDTVVVKLVAGKTSGKTSSYSAAQSTFSLLGSAGRVVLIALRSASILLLVVTLRRVATLVVATLVITTLVVVVLVRHDS